MHRSRPTELGRHPQVETPLAPLAPVYDSPPVHTPPPELIESWDPTDDEKGGDERRPVQWNWHGRQSWGRRIVAAFPVVAVVLAAGLLIHTTASAQGIIDQVQSVSGTSGATLLSSAPPLVAGGGSSGVGQISDYQNVTFSQPSEPSQPIQGSTSLALPPYVGWEANGSAGASNGSTVVSGGQLHVGVKHATPDFRGWFLTTSGATPATCAFQFTAASPPPVTVPSAQAVGELVMAVQTATTARSGDINYVLVAENVAADGGRNLTVGYSQGHLSRATEHILKQVPWTSGPLHVAIQTNGDNVLSVWVNGSLFYYAYILQLGIAPPFQPYLEVQARQTPYTVAYDGYSSVCQKDIVVTGLPEGSTAALDGRRVTAENGEAVFPAALSSPPVTGVLSLALAGNARPVRFARHAYWPGSRYSFAPGT
jgi:hypothetical protein